MLHSFTTDLRWVGAYILDYILKLPTSTCTRWKDHLKGVLFKCSLECSQLCCIRNFYATFCLAQFGWLWHIWCLHMVNGLCAFRNHHCDISFRRNYVTSCHLCAFWNFNEYLFLVKCCQLYLVCSHEFVWFEIWFMFFSFSYTLKILLPTRVRLFMVKQHVQHL